MPEDRFSNKTWRNLVKAKGRQWTTMLSRRIARWRRMNRTDALAEIESFLCDPEQSNGVREQLRKLLPEELDRVALA